MKGSTVDFSPVRMGMVGGGPGAFIGGIHRRAAALDGRIELVAGAFSRDPALNRDAVSGPVRVYDDWRALFDGEAARDPASRMEFVSIVTPNDSHAEIATAACAAGLHVFLEKPATRTLSEALALRDAVEEAGVRLALAHTYLGYPLVEQMRRLVAQGAIGRLRKIVCEYPQGWLSRPIEQVGQKQAAWRTDPAAAGIGGALGDIGVHAQNLVEYVSGQRIAEVCAHLERVVAGRGLDDDATVLFRTDGGASGQIWVSQVCAGEQNGLRLRLYGETGGLDWSHAEPNVLRRLSLDAPETVYRAGSDAAGLDPDVRARFRTPGGHPEGYIEAFADLYRAFAGAVRGEPAGATPLPGMAEGVRALAFVEAAVASAALGSTWVSVQGGLS